MIEQLVKVAYWAGLRVAAITWRGWLAFTDWALQGLSWQYSDAYCDTILTIWPLALLVVGFVVGIVCGGIVEHLTSKCYE